MTSLIRQIGSLAVRTFRREQQTTASNFLSQYEQLYNILNTIKAEDINLDPSLLQDRGTFNPSRDGAPVTYMQLYEDSDVTICVFILKKGVRLPMHDHPGMHGLLKVLHGTVAVQSYSFIANMCMDGVPVNQSLSGIFPAKKHESVTISASDPACRLFPEKQNVHEIYSLDGPAAFLDILSPPYGTDERLGIERDCHYYQELDGSFAPPQVPEGRLVWLVNVPSPTDFWCDQADYKGPPIEEDSDENGS
ncbi:2-aminoethanethiol dioxygenase-like [Penaeus japonicus]|uniref:2-aminoethanethiol dioxygenase-like n=1 Tax=Penaeus japonicus TaxID=27405 RepID=UPI001C715769|nr:2-aminoethanethiol dioxygenase-like [Penaeus japonicus]